MSSHRTTHNSRTGPAWANRAAPGDWALSARCRTPRAEHAALFDVKSEFFPNSPHENERIRAAKAFCRRCPVWSQCRAFAQDNNLVGVWGGEYFPVKNGGR